MSHLKYNMNQDPIEKIEARILYITNSTYGPDWHSEPHIHPFTEFFYVQKGMGNFFVEGETFPVKEHDFIIVNPHIEHTESSHKKSPMEYIAIGLEGMSFFIGNDSESRGYHVYNYESQQRELSFYLRLLLQEVDLKQFHYETVCQSILEVLIIKMMRRTNYSFTITASIKAKKECMAAKRYIDANYSSDINLDILAEDSHISKFYLVHSFTKLFDISPINYLTKIRIEQSKSLLESTNHSISQISNAVGFSSQAYFSNCFKKEEGMSPKEYRNSLQD